MTIQSIARGKTLQKNLVSLFIITLCISMTLMKTEADDQIWKPLPLRTDAQKIAGFPGGEGMQMVHAISYAPSNPSIVYMGVDVSQVWKSVDGGTSWVSKRNGFRTRGVISLVVDPLNENVVLASGSIHAEDAIRRGETNVSSVVDGIYRTLDGGDNWELVKQTDYYRGKEGQHFAFDPDSFDGNRHQTIYAATHSEGLFKSTDGGVTWIYIGLDSIRITDLELHRDGSNVILYVATDNMGVSSNGLYKVVNDGSPTQLGNLPDWPRTIAINPETDPNKDVIYAAVGSSKVYKSTDGGNSFISKINGLPRNKKKYMHINISQADPRHLYLKPGNISHMNSPTPFYSLDGGDTWVQPTDIDAGDLTTRGEASTIPAPVATHPSDPNIAITFLNAAIMKTTNGGKTWVYSSNGFMAGKRKKGKTSAYFDPVDPNRIIFFLGDHGPIISKNGGDTWQLLPVPWISSSHTTNVGAVDPNNPNLIITAVGSWTDQVLMRSTDEGQTWPQRWRHDGQTEDFRFISFNPDDTKYVYAGGDNTSFISNDKGKTWSELPNMSIRAMFPGNGDIIYAIKGGTELQRSADKGNSWTKVADMPFTNVRDVDMDPHDSNRLYFAAKREIWIWDGSSWMAVGKSGGIPVETFGTDKVYATTAIAVDPNHPNNVYAGTYANYYGHREKFIFGSKDYGVTWEEIKYNLEGYSTVLGLVVDPKTSDVHMSLLHGNYILPYNNLPPKAPLNFKIVSNP